VSNDETLDKKTSCSESALKPTYSEVEFENIFRGYTPEPPFTRGEWKGYRMWEREGREGRR
jgi:hypothetical protein